MRHLRYSLLALLCACGGGSSSGPEPVAPSGDLPAAEPATAHVIQLHRPATVGDRHLIVVEAERAESQVGTRGEQTVMNISRRSAVSFSAIRTVTAVNERGKVTGARYEVIEANETTSQGTRALVEQGATLIVTRSPEGGSIELEGGALEESVAEALRAVLKTRVAEETDDDVFGTDQPQVVGASWELDNAAAAAGLSRGGKLRVAPGDLGGEVRLTGVETVDGVECLQVAAEMTASRVELVGLPAGAEVRRAEFAASFDGAFPTDTTLPRIRGANGIVGRFDITTVGMDGQPVDLHMEMRQARAEMLGPVPE